jgi:sugar lactone lactonase YvrE
MTGARRPRRRSGPHLVALTVVLGALAATATAASPAHPVEQIVLPGATSAEGIAKGVGSTFYAGDLFGGDIYRGDLQHGTAELFIDAPAGRRAAGMDVDVRHGLLFVAGLFDGTARVYDTTTGATVATFQLTDQPTVINDVAITRTGAWFTDSLKPQLYFVPIGPTGVLGAPSTLQLSGPAADTSGAFNNNGIEATPDGKTLIVAHTKQGALNTVDPVTGESRTIAGVSVPSVDGIRLKGGQLFAVENFPNQIAEVRLSPDLTSGTVEKLVTNDLFDVPTGVVRFGDRLAAVNAKFDTGFPPTAGQYEVVIVDR